MAGEATAKIYVDSRHRDAKQFEVEFKTTYGSMLSREIIGSKGKGKNKGGESVLTPDDFLKAAGLTTEGKGSYSKTASLTLRTQVPFALEVRCIPQTDLHTKYIDHLRRIANRILQPDVML